MERKTVLITGASRGIGAGTAEVFGENGWNVALHYHTRRDKAEEVAQKLEMRGVQVELVQGDISDPEQAQKIIEQTLVRFGRLDSLVCNAGVALPQQLLTDTTAQQWRELMSVDLDGIFYVVRAAIPEMVRQKTGSIVTVSSMWGVTGGSCEVAYSAAKAGVIGLTRSLAKELGPSNIRVNCVAPGVIQTEMNAHLSQEDLDSLGEETPLGRIGTTREVGQAICFLAGEQAAFITGQVLCVDGGMVI